MDAYVVGTGPTELHAHIDLDRRVASIPQGECSPTVDVVAVSECDGHWSVVAAVQRATEVRQ